MDVGMMMVFASYGWENCSDARVWDEEIRLARLAADLGFDCLWSAEHHFNDYSFVPDNLQLMTYLTALCPDIDVGTAAVILPWHDPLRVAENAAVLDMLSKGRLRLGMGRGLARREFAAFRLSMDELRERFDEAAPMIVNALKTGFIEGDGKFYKQPRIEIRPRPQYSFDGRIYAVASSEDSIDSAAKLGAHIVMFADRPWEMRLPNIERGRELHRKYHGTEPPHIMLTEFCVCGTNLAETEEEARQYQGKFVESNFYHYEFLGEHFKTVKGYDSYQQKAEIARKAGLEGAVNGFMQAASWGTPDKILRGLEERRKIVGRFRAERRFPLRRHALTRSPSAACGCSRRRCCRCSNRPRSRPRPARRRSERGRLPGDTHWARYLLGDKAAVDDQLTRSCSRPCRQMSNPADSPLPMVIPAKAGIHWAAARLAEMWVPACAGTTIRADFDNRLSSVPGRNRGAAPPRPPLWCWCSGNRRNSGCCAARYRRTPVVC